MERGTPQERQALEKGHTADTFGKRHTAGALSLAKRNTSEMAGSWQEAHRRKGWLLEEVLCTRGKLLERKLPTLRRKHTNEEVGF
jgi:hypothetical protein